MSEEFEKLLINLLYSVTPEKWTEGRAALVEYVEDVERASVRDGLLAIELHKRVKELESENARLREALADIRDDARTGLKPDIYPTAESWLVSKVNRIAGMANRALRPEVE